MTPALEPYPAYRDSGLPWLGDVPKHWEVRRLKQIAQMEYGDSLASETRREGTVPVYGSNGLIGFHNVENTNAPCIIVGRKGSFGKISYSHAPVYAIDTAFFIDAASTSVDIRWLYFLLLSLSLDEVTKDSAIPGLNREDAYQRLAPLPTASEQTAIARYLDHVRERVDCYIGAKERLISLLNERKQAIINRAVTRGLDPNAPMKQTGIDWMPEVPAHWQVRPLKHWVREREGMLGEWTDPDYEFDYLDIGCVGTGFLASNPERMRFGDAPSRARKIVQKGDTIISMVRTYLKAVYYIRDDWPNLIASTGFAVLRPIRDVRPELLGYILQSSSFIEQVSANSTGVSYPAIPETKLGTLCFAAPTEDHEQLRILEFICQETSRLDAAVRRIQRELSLIREYCERLISDVVTGKLDVRESRVAGRNPSEETVARRGRRPLTEAFSDSDALSA